ncbi:hypothetical protein WHR41_02866 [Cladosporium halotolerans]|uniref:Conidiation-specific protein 8 n=1 Tax=Cladosporium halotolerans TaxID=1052096 RepID=A0AB34KWN5_9PEZI
MDAQNNKTPTDGHRRSSGELFNKITNMKRDPQNDNAAARRASLEEQTVPRGAGPIGDMWNKFTRGTANSK